MSNASIQTILRRNSARSEGSITRLSFSENRQHFSFKPILRCFERFALALSFFTRFLFSARVPCIATWSSRCVDDRVFASTECHISVRALPSGIEMRPKLYALSEYGRTMAPVFAVLRHLARDTHL